MPPLLAGRRPQPSSIILGRTSSMVPSERLGTSGDASSGQREKQRFKMSSVIAGRIPGYLVQLRLERRQSATTIPVVCYLGSADNNIPTSAWYNVSPKTLLGTNCPSKPDPWCSYEDRLPSKRIHVSVFYTTQETRSESSAHNCGIWSTCECSFDDLVDMLNGASDDRSTAR